MIPRSHNWCVPHWLPSRAAADMSFPFYRHSYCCYNTWFIQDPVCSFSLGHPRLREALERAAEALIDGPWLTSV